jgi:hypothetical protein
MSGFEEAPAPALGLVAERLAAFEQKSSFRLRSGSNESRDLAAAAELLNKERSVSINQHYRMLCINYKP